MSKTINYLFYLKTPKQNNQPALPIYLRITVDGQRAEISTGQTTTTDKWNQAKGRLKGTNEEVRIVNATLDSLLNKAKKAFQDLSDRNKPTAAINIKNQMLGISQQHHSIVQCFENFVKEITLKIGSDYEVVR